MALIFRESNHRYYLDGKPVTGVTTILGKGLPKPALPYWSAKAVAEYVADNPAGIETLRMMGRAPMVAALKNVPWQKRDEAAIRGTDVHAIAERVIHGEEVEVPPHLAAHVEGYVRWLDAFDVEPILTEFRCASRKHWFAGTGDAIVRIGGRTLALDWKTSSRVYGETSMQVAAYAGAEFYADDDGEHPIPEVDGIGVVHVTENGSQFFEFKDRDAAWTDFLAVKAVADAIGRIEKQLGEPTPYPSEEEVA